MRFVGVCYRAHHPAWSFAPHSGDGAAKKGGRFNRIGEPTLYLSLAPCTVFREWTQAGRQSPLTLCEYDVDCDDIADLQDDGCRRAHDVVLEDLACGWLELQLADKVAPSWVVVDRLKATGYVGTLVPSFAPGATGDDINLVLWRYGPELPHRVRVYDPKGGLPADQASWPYLER